MADQDIKIEDGMVVSMDYTLRADNEAGEVLDSSEGRSPLQFMQGQGQVIPGLERELYGMRVGDEKSVTVEPAEGYGEEDPDAYSEVPREAFPADMQPEPGMALGVRDEAGNVYQAYVEEIRPDSIVLNFNHPLAGQTLHFKVRIADLRPATAEEQAHGHIHDDNGDGIEHETHEMELCLWQVQAEPVAPQRADELMIGLALS
jgi:FKBP-type peptidyl-prolyl cis-trans isomerase SlyD